MLVKSLLHCTKKSVRIKVACTVYKVEHKISRILMVRGHKNLISHELIETDSIFKIFLMAKTDEKKDNP